MSDLVERLRRRIVVDGCEMPGNDALHREAADEIERLQHDNEGLRNTIKLQAEGKYADVMGTEEIERLRAALNNASNTIAMQGRDIDALRAALERIANAEPMNRRTAHMMRDTAREALKGE